MTPKLLYRIAAVTLVLFALGHTFGFLTFQPTSPGGAAVYEAMNSARFEFNGARYSYGDFYTGFGLTVTAYMVLAAFLAWHLGAASTSKPRSVTGITWVFAFVQFACFVLNLAYFFLVPAMFSGVIVICLIWAGWLVRIAGARRSAITARVSLAEKAEGR